MVKQSGPRSSLGSHGFYVFTQLVGYLLRWWTRAQWNFEFKLNLTFRVKVNRPKTIRILTKVFCTSGPNLVIKAWAGWRTSSLRLTYGHTHTYTFTQTDTGNGNTRRPKVASCKTQNNFSLTGKFYFKWIECKRFMLQTGPYQTSYDVMIYGPWFILCQFLGLSYKHAVISQNQACNDHLLH